MTLFSFPQSAAPPSASDRGSPLNLAPVAPIVVLSSQDDMRTVVRVRYFSQALATVRYRQGHTGILNLFGHLARGLLRSPHQACKQAASCFTNGLKAFSAAVAHESNHAAKARPDVGYE